MSKKSGLHAGTTQQRITDFMRTIDGIVDCTVSGRYTHAWAVKRVEINVYAHPNFKSLSRWARSAIANYFAGKVDMINRHLTFTGCVFNGVIYAAPGQPLALYANWTLLRMGPGAIRVPEQTDQFGQYWSNGQPFSVIQNRGVEALHVVQEEVAEPA